MSFAVVFLSGTVCDSLLDCLGELAAAKSFKISQQILKIGLSDHRFGISRHERLAFMAHTLQGALLKEVEMLRRIEQLDGKGVFIARDAGEAFPTLESHGYRVIDQRQSIVVVRVQHGVA